MRMTENANCYCIGNNLSFRQREEGKDGFLACEISDSLIDSFHNYRDDLICSSNDFEIAWLNEEYEQQILQHSKL
jgi:hypothetical protein